MQIMDQQKFQNLMKEARARFCVPSLSAAVYCNGETFTFQDGMSNQAEGIQADSETMYAIGSCTKAFLAAAICVLVDRGEMKLDDCVKKYVPEFEMTDPWVGEHLSIRDILCHRSGLPRHELAWYSRMFTLKSNDIVRMLKYLEPNAPFRSVYQYNNIMFAFLGVLLERATGLSWQENIRKNVWEPLGITRAAFTPTEAKALGNVAVPYVYDSEADRHIALPNAEMAAIGPAGSIYMSAPDLMKFVTMLMNGGEYEGKRVLSAYCAGEMTRLHVTSPDHMEKPLQSLSHTAGYGLALRTEIYRGVRMVEHGGHIDGYMAEQCFLPDEKFAIVLLTNLGVIHACTAMLYIGLEEYFCHGPEMMDALREDLQHEYDVVITESLLDKLAKEPAKEDKKPCPVSLSDIAGHYYHPGYGDLTVTVEGERLKLQIGTIGIDAAHDSGTDFISECMGFAPGLLFHDSIEVDEQGKVIAICLEANLEPGSKPVRFIPV